MKSYFLPYSMVLLILASGCQPSHPCDEIVSEAYMHRYGVPLEPQEWNERGQHGQIISTRKDGVVITKTFDSGILHGQTSYTFPHQNIIQKEEFYEHGTLKKELWHYFNGMPEKEILYLYPNKEITTVWYENSAPQRREEKENGLLVRGEYFDFSNQLESKVENGNGMRVCRDGYGQTLFRDEVKDGSIHLRTTYHSNGYPQSITPYGPQEKIQGERRTFLPGGEPYTVENWEDNRQQGITTVFCNGEKHAEVPYVNSKKEGIEKRYRNGTLLVEEINWVQGKRHGPSYSYVGNTKKTDWYFQGKLVNKATFEVLSNQ